jgi:hypothetical protein
MQEKRRAAVHLENNGRGMLFIGEGVISGEELIRQTEKSYDSEALNRLQYQIIDLRDVHRMDITADQMRKLAELDCKAAERSSGTKIAIVASHDLTFGLSRIYSAYAQSPNLQARIFRTMNEARAWIGEPACDSPDFTPLSGNV